MVDQVIEVIEFTGKCSFCPKTFKTKNQLSCHEKRVHGEKTLQCPQCPKAYALIADFKQHIKMVHERFIKCKICDFSCGTDFLLKKHISENHSNEEFTCNECEYKSKSISQLK